MANINNFTNPFEVANIYKTDKLNYLNLNSQIRKQYKSLNSLLQECPLLGMQKYGNSMNLIA